MIAPPPTSAPALLRSCKISTAAGKHAEILAAVQACLPKDEAGNFIAEQERSDAVHDLLAFLAERMLEMNKQKQQEIRGFLGLAGALRRSKGRGSHPQDQAARVL